MTTKNQKRLTVADVTKRLNRSRNSLYYQMSKGSFPRPHKTPFGQIYWNACDVEPLFKEMGV